MCVSNRYNTYLKMENEMKITFKNLDKSELAISACKERFESLYEKFPNLKAQDIAITLCMDNSPTQGGLDVFGVTLRVRKGVYQGIAIKKSAPKLYLALAELVESVHERLKRFDEKKRKMIRQKSRNKKSIFINENLLNEYDQLHTYP